MIHRYCPFYYLAGGVLGYCQKLFGVCMTEAGGLFSFNTLGVSSIGAKGGGYCAGYVPPSGAMGTDLTPQAVKFMPMSIINNNLIKRNFICSVLTSLIKNTMQRHSSIVILNILKYP
jgi:hypothetical protein